MIKLSKDGYSKADIIKTLNNTIDEHYPNADREKALEYLTGKLLTR